MARSQGFHALIASGTTPKLLEKESQTKMIGYGGMLTESFVAIMALVTACILDQHLYFALNAPAALTGGTPETAAEYVNNLPLGTAPITPDVLTQAAEAVGEESIISRTGGAPTLAFGMSEVLSDVFGGDSLKSFWYPLRDHVRGALHPHHDRCRHPASLDSCSPTRSATSAVRQRSSRTRRGASARGCAR